MLVAILRGSDLDGADGWFGPAQSRYTWAWLTGRCGLDARAKAIPRDKFPGPDALFDALFPRNLAIRELYAPLWQVYAWDGSVEEPRWSVAWSTAMAGRSPASSISVGRR